MSRISTIFMMQIELFRTPVMVTGFHLCSHLRLKRILTIVHWLFVFIQTLSDKPFLRMWQYFFKDQEHHLKSTSWINRKDFRCQSSSSKVSEFLSVWQMRISNTKAQSDVSMCFSLVYCRDTFLYVSFLWMIKICTAFK